MNNQETERHPTPSKPTLKTWRMMGKFDFLASSLTEEHQWEKMVHTLCSAVPFFLLEQVISFNNLLSQAEPMQKDALHRSAEGGIETCPF